MAIGTYTELQASIASWLERDDDTAVIPDFISLAESRLNRLLGIRTRETDASLTGVASSRFIALPTGFRSPQAMWVVQTWGRDELRPVTPAELVTSTTEGLPTVWAVDGSNIAFERPCDQAYSFQLREEIGLALSDAAPTNLVLTNYPDLYLFGAMVEAATFHQDDGMLGRFEPRFREALDEARHKENRANALAPLRTEISAGMLGQRLGFDIRRGW